MNPDQLSHDDLVSLVETTLDTIAAIMADAGLTIGPVGGNDASARGGR